MAKSQRINFLEMFPLFGESDVWRPVFVWLYELFTEDCAPHSAGIPPPVYVHSARTEAAGRAARRQSRARRETSTSPRPWSTSLSWRGGALLPPPFIPVCKSTSRFLPRTNKLSLVNIKRWSGSSEDCLTESTIIF